MIHDLLQGEELDAAESTVRECAQKLRQQHQRYLGLCGFSEGRKLGFSAFSADA